MFLTIDRIETVAEGSALLKGQLTMPCKQGGLTGAIVRVGEYLRNVLPFQAEAAGMEGRISPHSLRHTFDRPSHPLLPRSLVFESAESLHDEEAGRFLPRGLRKMACPERPLHRSAVLQVRISMPVLGVRCQELGQSAEGSGMKARPHEWKHPPECGGLLCRQASLSLQPRPEFHCVLIHHFHS